jgi:hypothetical protein
MNSQESMATKTKLVRRLAASCFRIGMVVGLTLGVVACLMMQPTCSSTSAKLQARSDLLREHVKALTESFGPRYHDEPENLAKCSGFLIEKFQESGARTSEQSYHAGGREFKNVRAFFGPENAPRIVVGAHYDSCEEGGNTVKPGADDNASGVAVLLELARLLQQNHPTKTTVELVAYPAIMVTDTAFYRNSNYHESTDTWQTLDYPRMAHVVTQVHQAVMKLGESIPHS